MSGDSRIVHPAGALAAETTTDFLSASPRASTQAELKATLLHRNNRRRALHFNAPVMADSAMDLMLTLFVGHEQRRVVDRVALAMLNSLTPVRADTLLSSLSEAGLTRIEGECWGLTDRGARLMSAYLEFAAPVV